MAAECPSAVRHVGPITGMVRVGCRRYATVMFDVVRHVCGTFEQGGMPLQWVRLGYVAEGNGLCD